MGGPRMASLTGVGGEKKVRWAVGYRVGGRRKESQIEKGNDLIGTKKLGSHAILVCMGARGV